MASFDRLGVGDEPADRAGGHVRRHRRRGRLRGRRARKSVRAVILYPRGRVSPFQQLQLCCWGEPVIALEVDGDFDDCQRLVKAAFADPALARAHRLTSANSINIGRLLPQMVYHRRGRLARACARPAWRPASSSRPAISAMRVAALWARGLGLPVGPVVAVTNANRTLSDWHRERRLPAAAGRGDARQRDGRRRAEQFRAARRGVRPRPARWRSSASTTTRSARGSGSSMRAAALSSGARIRRPRPRPMRRLDPAVRGGADLDRRGDRASVQVRRGGRAPDRRDPGAAARAGGDPRPAVTGAVDPGDARSVWLERWVLRPRRTPGRPERRSLYQAPLVTAPCEAEPTSRAYLA